jgi:hypothetical protein
MNPVLRLIEKAAFGACLCCAFGGAVVIVDSFAEAMTKTPAAVMAPILEPNVTIFRSVKMIGLRNLTTGRSAFVARGDSTHRIDREELNALFRNLEAARELP